MNYRPIFLSCLATVFATVFQAAAQDSKLAPPQPSHRIYDPRLPPVLPGEEVVTEDGGKMKVWSSSGPVPVSPTVAPKNYRQGEGNAVGVIVDGRDLRSRDRQNRGQ